VIDACVANMSHNTIPHFNYAIEMMAKKTGAFQAVFSNDLDNLRWPKIREWDAIYLNDTVGELFADLEIRESLLRYVWEGRRFGRVARVAVGVAELAGVGRNGERGGRAASDRAGVPDAGRSEESDQPVIRRRRDDAH
jgi:hypothetical protein